MPEIILRTGEIAYIDDQDTDLAPLRWYVSNTYATRKVRTADGWTNETLHRVILSRMVGRPLTSSEHTDHINGNRLDNRRSNLRVATRQQNMQNKARRKDGTSGFKGVSWDKDCNKWRARIYNNKRNLYLGLFDTPEAAAIAYNAAAIEHYGDFARLNDIPSHLHPTAILPATEQSA